MRNIASGHEGTIYQINETEVIKQIFRPTPNKMAKINHLMQYQIENFHFPKAIYNGANFQNSAYLMDLVQNQTHKNMQKAIEDQSVTVKINYFKQLEANLKKAHQDGISVIDLNLSNFIPTENGLKMVDTDNYHLDNYPIDAIPINYYYYFIAKVSDKITPEIDKFSFALKLLDSLIDIPIYYLTVKNNVIKDPLEDLIKRLEVDAIFKEYLLQAISDSETREYAGDILDLVTSDKQYIKYKTKI